MFFRSNVYHGDKLNDMWLLVRPALADLARAGVLVETCGQVSVCAAGKLQHVQLVTRSMRASGGLCAMEACGLLASKSPDALR